jgi:hypothetical protein
MPDDASSSHRQAPCIPPGCGPSARATVSHGSTRSPDFGSTVVGMPDPDLGRPPGPAITSLQISGGAAGRELPDGRGAAAHMLSSLAAGHRHRGGGVPGVERILDVGVHRHRRAG